MGYKIPRLEKIMEREIGTIFLNSKDERLRFVTITKVSLTNDASVATVFYTVLGTNEQKESTKKNVENASGFVRSSLGKTLEVRKVPELRFKYDESMMYGEHIDNILKNITYFDNNDDSSDDK